MKYNIEKSTINDILKSEENLKNLKRTKCDLRISKSIKCSNPLKVGIIRAPTSQQESDIRSVFNVAFSEIRSKIAEGGFSISLFEMPQLLGNDRSSLPKQRFCLEGD